MTSQSAGAVTPRPEHAEPPVGLVLGTRDWLSSDCVRLAAKGLLDRGRRVFVVEDAIETLKAEDGERTVAELKSMGAQFINTDQALAMLG